MDNGSSEMTLQKLQNQQQKWLCRTNETQLQQMRHNIEVAKLQKEMESIGNGGSEGNIFTLENMDAIHGDKQSRPCGSFVQAVSFAKTWCTEPNRCMCYSPGQNRVLEKLSGEA